MLDAETTQVLEPVPPPSPPPAPKRSRARGYWLLAIGMLIVLLAGATLYAIAPLRTPLPTAAVTRTLPEATRIPGKAPVVPWPRTGQAALSVEGVGSFGTSGGNEPVPIASVTKVMTAYVILTEHPLDRGEHGPKLTVSAAQAAAYPAELARGESLVPVVAGAVFTERQALQAVLLPSANNMARILAAWDAGSVEAFVEKMNDTADALGMKDTRYTDPSGLDPGTVSTAVDQVILARKAMELPAFAEIVAQKKATLPVAGEVKNYNSLVGRDGVVGIKTGSTDEAGGCLVFAAVTRVGGRKITIVGAVLGQPGANTPVQLDRVFKATRPLVRTAAAALTVHPVVKVGDQVATVQGPLGTGTTIHAGKELSVVGWPGMRVRLDVDIPAVPDRLAAETEHGSITAVAGHGAPVTGTLRSGVRLEPPSDWDRIRQHR
ncbi:D-alanyl-D-alanine carboxypeptidase [Micromonospora sp. WMMD1102]|uniref:D-alanyl-D-alanine carboxypeptidase family protein n=1 Tax=Micromonospora sp. WMMD1102 TaxID=3016105 RepID=UPI00241554A4|nr:D-alanyl-D-alanine carboxypeptidase [Micromonospora sp. WMMD1102]MDG4791055.1 D-alanyl-D-alanine carboxypeptidase [Micromonospora sp. WMMD1102]MDG4792237.1 D-alanyl-D-alanine carboxypeptidase [Micromonospora sp. WMMD1102]MDG4792252.1 D-alanyl-D-alanine carboxypeptidase [Micromonospora sp. WMMD1102]